jgi:hypothetical protein
MIMVSFVEVGMISFRTRCMELERAARFARCLSANETRFTDVEIRESKKARGAARWFVCYQPANPRRQAAMLSRQQDLQEQRAAEREYTVVRDPDHDYLHVFSHHSGDTHEVSLAGASCTCGHFTYRLRGTGVLCSHLVAAADATRRGEVGEFRTIPTPVPAPSQRSADRDQFAEIWGGDNEDWLK